MTKSKSPSNADTLPKHIRESRLWRPAKSSSQFTSDKFSWIAEVYRDSQLAIVTALAIADHWNADGRPAWPSLDRLADISGLNVRQVKRQVAMLIKGGHLDSLKGTGGPFKQQSSQYQMKRKSADVMHIRNLSRVTSMSPESSDIHAHSRVTSMSTVEGHLRSESSDIDVPLTIEENNGNERIESNTEGEGDSPHTKNDSACEGYISKEHDSQEENHQNESENPLHNEMGKNPSQEGSSSAPKASNAANGSDRTVDPYEKALKWFQSIYKAKYVHSKLYSPAFKDAFIATIKEVEANGQQRDFIQCLKSYINNPKMDFASNPFEYLASKQWEVPPATPIVFNAIGQVEDPAAIAFIQDKIRSEQSFDQKARRYAIEAMQSERQQGVAQ